MSPSAVFAQILLLALSGRVISASGLHEDGEANNTTACVLSGEKCSLYTSTCCDSKYCTAGKNFLRDGMPVCTKHASDDIKNITYGHEMLPGWEVGDNRKPAVLMLQEWWGINEAIKQMAEHVAQQGYRVLVPDLYRGQVALTALEAQHLSSMLNWTRANLDFVEAVSYLKETGSHKVVAIGFCQGGGLSLCAAQKAGVIAASAFYGYPRPENCQIDQIKVPVEVHVGTLDRIWTSNQTNASVANMTAAGVKVDSFVYPGLPHAFMNGLTPAGRKGFGYNGSSAAMLPNEAEVTLGFQRMLAFFHKHLGVQRRFSV